MSDKTDTTLISNVHELRHVMQIDNRRDIYLADGGGYFVSYQGGEVPEDILAAALKLGMLKPRWPDKTRICCWVMR